jgi:hypothetical protein
VFSLCYGDSLTYWRQEPFQFCIGGNIWYPPNIQNLQKNEGMAELGLENNIIDESEHRIFLHKKKEWRKKKKKIKK